MASIQRCTMPMCERKTDHITVVTEIYISSNCDLYMIYKGPKMPTEMDTNDKEHLIKSMKNEQAQWSANAK